ncbi:MotA/TolQ/ExbB proton channel family protein [Undibacterium sp.]|uniref:MotA/TolQ/ExbB proton channel family protein n=1 Tax=Undibacterium sp. TaxID=1914977 RepID=UPI0025CF1493|nr:MotA/TolQ/ExbB proton channel family protein [Undibacterium sp.]
MSAALTQYWTQVDGFSHLLSYVLLLMSLLSWTTILAKAWSFRQIRAAAVNLPAFWKSPSNQDALALLTAIDKEDVFAGLARQALAGVDPVGRSGALNAKAEISDVLTQALRQELNRVTVKLESGLSPLASIGATAPFVGLLGTVWGIYHALSTVAGSGAVQIDQLARPVGEALIMTALGLIVAIPAVLAYNAFNRINRITFAELDAFAYDLHAYLSKAE